MSFKNFQNLNDKLAEFGDTSQAADLQSLLDIKSRLQALAERIAQNFAKAYSQVQWMKYSSDGDPQDVTPADQTSVPDSIIASAKSELISIKAALSGIQQGQQTVSYTPVLSASEARGSYKVYFEEGQLKCQSPVSHGSDEFISPTTIMRFEVDARTYIDVDAESVYFTANESPYCLGFSQVTAGSDVYELIRIDVAGNSEMKILILLSRTNGTAKFVLPPVPGGTITAANWANCKFVDATFDLSTWVDGNTIGIDQLMNSIDSAVSSTVGARDWIGHFVPQRWEIAMYHDGVPADTISKARYDLNDICVGSSDLMQAIESL